MNFFRILKVLNKHNVQYIVIGGVSAVINGAPVTTFDLDIVHNREKENLEKLLRALTEINARYRARLDIVIRPDISGLSSPGHHLLLTDMGPLDLLGTFGNGRDYNDLLSESNLVEIGQFKIYVQSLESLIKLKQEIGRDKDKAMIPILLRTIEEQK